MQGWPDVRYEDFKTGLTYQDVYAMLWVDNEDSSTWARKSRGAVLRLWGKLKADMWAEYTGGLSPHEEYFPTEYDADGVAVPTDDDYLEPEGEDLPAEAHEMPRMRQARQWTSAAVSSAGAARSSRAVRPDAHAGRVPESRPAWQRMRRYNQARAGPDVACSRAPFGPAKPRSRRHGGAWA